MAFTRGWAAGWERWWWWVGGLWPHLWQQQQHNRTCKHTSWVTVQSNPWHVLRAVITASPSAAVSDRPPSFLPPFTTFNFSQNLLHRRLRDHRVWKAERNSMKSSSGASPLWRTSDNQSVNGWRKPLTASPRGLGVLVVDWGSTGCSILEGAEPSSEEPIERKIQKKKRWD